MSNAWFPCRLPPRLVLLALHVVALQFCFCVISPTCMVWFIRYAKTSIRETTRDICCRMIHNVCLDDAGMTMHA